MATVIGDSHLSLGSDVTEGYVWRDMLRGPTPERNWCLQLAIVPLCWRPKASLFWIMLLLNSDVRERKMIDADEAVGDRSSLDALGCGPKHCWPSVYEFGGSGVRISSGAPETQ